MLLGGFAANSSFFVSFNSSNVFLCSNSVASEAVISLFISPQEAVGCLESRDFSSLTGILREILAGSSVASENADLFAAMSFFNVPNSSVTCVAFAFFPEMLVFSVEFLLV